MRRALHIALVAATLAACSARNNGFGDPSDAGRDANGDAGDDGGDSSRRADVGEPCAAPDDCVADAMCIGNVAGDFVCMAQCAQAYDLCADGSICLPVMTDDAAICYIGGTMPATAPCANNLECAAGLLCFGANAEYYCRRACDETSGDCAPGEACVRLESGAGLCRAIVGAACATSADCGDGLACSAEIADVSGAFAGGYCTKSCVQDADCPSTAVCGVVPGAASGICLQACQHRSDCRFNAGYECASSSICGGSSDPDACRELFGVESLCVPGPF